MADNVLVLLSGGMDSIVCAHLAHRDRRLKAALFFNYGQGGAAAEGSCAREWCHDHKINFLPVMLPPLFGQPIRTGVGARGPRVVPARNAIFTSCAASYAVSMQCPVIWYGAMADDAEDYADCRREWIDAMSEVIHLAAGVRLEAPLIGMSKLEVVALGNELGVQWERTWSCYQPRNGITPCGSCNACVKRSAALSRTCEA